MEITKLNKSCFRLKGKKAIILIDPSVEIKNLTVHVLIFSSKPKETFKVKGAPVVISGPGEYEVRTVRILGAKEKGKVVYKIVMDGLSLLYLNRVEEKISEENLEFLGSADLLFLPVKRKKLASSLTGQLEPFMIIPTDDEGLEDFVKEEGLKNVEKLRALTITKDELPEDRKVVVLK